MSSTHRAGYVGIVGRPNAGKSTFLNKVLGQKLSITSRKPQTTRNRVVGIHNTDQVQAILVDTPGHHEAWTELNKRMVKVAEDTLADVDAVLMVVDLVPAVHQARAGNAIRSAGEDALLQLAAAAGHPVVLALNKIDVIDPAWALPVIEAWRERHPFHAVIPCSALTGDGVDRVMGTLEGLLPEHPPFFPKDQATDASERFVVAELIREKAFHLLEAELPYAVAVEIEEFDESQREGERPRVRILARVLVERPSQKPIVIGRGGQMLKRIGTLARQDIQRLLSASVHLELFVRVEPDWTRRGRVLDELGYP